LAGWLDAVDIVIQPAKAAERPAIRALLQNADLPVDDFDAAPLGLWVARAAGNVVGTIALEQLGPDGLLRSLAVAGWMRGLGTGRGLVLTLEQHARRAGVVTLILLTTTAARYFQSLGYSTIERERAPASVRNHAQFRTLCPATAVCMVKHLA
jgi:amino-acid N-acetyltransferase